MEEQLMTRRGFAAATSAAMVGALAAGAAYANEDSTQSARSDAAEPDWNEEHEIVIIGAGNAIFSAIAAQHEGADVVVLEKASSIGGTMKFSEGGVWIPCNSLMPENVREQDSLEKAVTYMKNCDLYGTHSEDSIRSWAEDAPKALDYLLNELGTPIYYLIDGWDYSLYDGSTTGRSLAYGSPDVPFTEWWSGCVEPYVDSFGLDIRLQASAQHLIQDASGAVVGVEYQDADGNTAKIKATKGVLLATGSFDHDHDLVSTYLFPPLVSSLCPPEITGDGLRMGLEVGARIDHMSACYHTPAVITGHDEVMETLPWWTAAPGAIYVNRDGRRVVDESADYDEVGKALRNNVFHRSGMMYPLSGNTTLIADSRCVTDWGWPGGSDTQPDWLREYQSLEELAEGEGIDIDGLTDEVNRYNGFCQTGVDLDFNRSEGAWGGEAGQYSFWYGTSDAVRTDLPKWQLVPVEEPPFYAATLGFGSIGTKGGLVTDDDSRVLGESGVIPGFYAAGCVADAPVVGYPGGGWPNAVSLVNSLRAVRTMLGHDFF